MRRRLALLLALGAFSACQPAGARAGVANAGIAGAPRGNPLAGLPWGNYSGPLDEVFPAYRAAIGVDRQLLGYIALAPRMRWFGQWYGDPARAAIDYLRNVTGGDPRVLAQMAVFGLVPWEGAASQRLPTAPEQAAYRSWIDGLAAGIGSARVVLVLQPDLPLALDVPHHSTLPLRLVADAARRLAALPHATVYIDAGASDWETVSQAVWLLRTAGVRHTRGFALGATHYATTSDEVRFGAQVVSALARAGVPGMHFVLNTAQNGRGFTYQQYGHPASYDNAPACRTPGQQRCVTLGIPPTTDVAARRWGLPADLRALAARHEDADLWIGRPWLENQSDPFELARSLDLARTWPFAP